MNQVGARVLEADSAERGRQLAAERVVDAFLLDIRLPDTNGIELCRSIRAMEKHKNAPIIFITSVDEREILQWAFEAGGDDFIQKPVDGTVLRKRLSNLLLKAAYVRQIELMGNALRRYVSPRTEEMARLYATTRLLPGPRQMEVCILFSDARGFTELSQQLDPEDVFQMLSDHLGAQVNVVYDHGGYIDKFAGDGILAVFDGRDKLRSCCLSALEIMRLSGDAAARRGSRIARLGIGVHKGLAVIGNLGSKDHLDYTLIGNTVNLATRLCGIADQSIVASDAFADAAAAVPGVLFTNRRQVKIRGYPEPQTVYDLVGPGR